MATTIDGTTGISQVQDGIVGTNKLAAGAVTPVKTQVGALPSMVRLNTANGYGSTNTKIRRFTNVVTNQGSDITYADSAANGASFTINTNGVYSISHSAQYTTGGGYAGISLNASGADLTTNIINIAASKIASIGYIANAAAPVSSSATLYLSAGDVIRPHTDGNAAGTATACDQFIIQRVA